MIVHMTVLDNNMKRVNLNFSRSLGLLFTLLSIISCNSNITDNGDTGVKNQCNKVYSDSIEISVSIPPNESFGINVINSNYDSYFLIIKNDQPKDTVLKKRIPRNHNKQVLKYMASVPTKKGFKLIKHHYILSTAKRISFSADTGKLSKTGNNDIIIADKLCNSYDNFKKSSSKNLAGLDSLYQYFSKSYSGKNDSLLSELNQLYYINNLQILNPANKKADAFLLDLESMPIASDVLHSMLFEYTKNRIDTLNFKDLTTDRYSKLYVKLISMGVYKFLKIKANRGNEKYQKAINWLKSSSFYIDNKETIAKNIEPLSSELFKKHLKKLPLLSTDFSSANMNEVISDNKAQYYLIDFWATWCKPCLEGINSIHNMNIPDNIRIINLSTDKPDNRELWKEKAEKTDQKVSYLIDVTKQESKDFFRLIELKRIPRYILIDKDMNLLDESFLHPNEPEFLNRLNNIRFFYRI